MLTFNVDINLNQITVFKYLGGWLTQMGRTENKAAEHGGNLEQEKWSDL